MGYTSSMTMKREAKAKVQQAATSTKPVRTASPTERAKYGTFLPAALGRKIAASAVRENKTFGRTREMVVGDKIKARRTAGMRGRTV